MKQPMIPDVDGIKKMSPLEMNGIRFSKQHTVLTPEVIVSLENPRGKHI